MDRRIPSLLLVALVAVVAFVLGSVGTATAVGLTKGQVKKIATKVVKRQAPGLSVATASNAGNLNGRPGTAYQDRVAQGTVQFVTVNSPTFVVLIPSVPIQVAPGQGFLEVAAQATFVGGSTNVTTWFQVDAADCGTYAGPGFTHRPLGNTTPSADNIGYTLVVPVSPGSHTVTLCGSSSAFTQASATLVARTVNGGSAGGTSLRSSAPPGGVDDDTSTPQ